MTTDERTARLRIIFTRADLARVRLASGQNPLWEVVLSLHQLGGAEGSGGHRAWAGWARSAIGGHAAVAARRLYQLASPGRYFPDFLTPTEGGDGLDQGLDAVLRTPPTRVRDELIRRDRVRRVPAWGRRLADDRPARQSLIAAIRTYHRATLRPFRSALAAALRRHRADLTRRSAAGGVGGLLSGLGPGFQWQDPVLSAPYPVDATIPLRGRGLTVQPAVFCRREPVALVDPALDPVLVVPVEPAPQSLAADDQPRPDDRLIALLGVSRARVLQSLITPAGTVDLGRRAGLSTSSASEHAAILRGAGLITSHRRGRHTVHALTDLGQDLLAGPGHEPA